MSSYKIYNEDSMGNILERQAEVTIVPFPCSCNKNSLPNPCRENSILPVKLCLHICWADRSNYSDVWIRKRIPFYKSQNQQSSTTSHWHRTHVPLNFLPTNREMSSPKPMFPPPETTAHLPVQRCYIEICVRILQNCLKLFCRWILNNFLVRPITI